MLYSLYHTIVRLIRVSKSLKYNILFTHDFGTFSPLFATSVLEEVFFVMRFPARGSLGKIAWFSRNSNGLVEKAISALKFMTVPPGIVGPLAPSAAGVM